jgi:hypothetical protein
MTLPTTIALIVLVTINMIVGLLLLLGKLKLVIVRKPNLARAAPPSEPEPFDRFLPAAAPKKQRGRPRKSTSKRKARHLHLPINITKEQLGDVAEFFQKHKDDRGERIVLHITPKNGPEQEIEVPYPVRWNDSAQNDFSSVLGGWS